MANPSHIIPSSTQVSGKGCQENDPIQSCAPPAGWARPVSPARPAPTAARRSSGWPTSSFPLPSQIGWPCAIVKMSKPSRYNILFQVPFATLQRRWRPVRGWIKDGAAASSYFQVGAKLKELAEAMVVAANSLLANLRLFFMIQQIGQF